MRVTDVAPIERREALTLAGHEYALLLAMLDSLDDAQWQAATDCTAWNVHRMVAHIVGNTEAVASLRENIHQQLYARREPGARVDGMTAVQVRERETLSRAELLRRLERAARRSIPARRRTPSPMRALRIKVEMPGATETWTLRYLQDVIYTRDTWMHRVDVHRATGAPLTLTAAHDGRIIADVVADWSRRVDKPFELVLGGPAGGTFTRGDAGDRIEMDAVEFCRVLSGRAPGTGLAATPVPF